MFWDDKRYHSLSFDLKETFGTPLYKLALDGGFTCPNRDGTLDRRGCIFCAGGSGTYAASTTLSIDQQIQEAKSLISEKHKKGPYIGYFQAFTNTYGPLEVLESLFTQTIHHPDIGVLSIATRPDCLPQEVIDLLAELNQVKPVWVELGLQTCHDTTADFIRRGYPLSVFEDSVTRLRSAGLTVIVHMILGLPGETHAQIVETAAYCGKQNIQGIKLQLLHVLKGTDLAPLYQAKAFELLSMEDYADLLIDCLEVLPPHIVIHRITGDAPRALLIAPAWSGHKKKVLNYINHRMKVRQSWQGRCYKDGKEF